MDSEQWKQLDKLLHAVLERPPEEREAFLREACVGDERLEREARSLLMLEEKAEGFLERPAIEVAARVGGRDLSIAPMPLSAGDKLGHYEVVSLLGKGGMGEVYRVRDTKLKRDVALKVLPAKFLRDPERMARFQREAQRAGVAGPSQHRTDLWNGGFRRLLRVSPGAGRRTDAGGSH